MRFITIFTGIALCVGAAVILYVKSCRAGLIPRRILFGMPERTAPQISHDGKLLAYLASINGVLNIHVRTVDGRDDRQITDEKERSITGFEWAPDDTQILYARDKDGDENWHIYGAAVRRADGTYAARDYTPFDNIHAGILAVSPDVRDEILIILNKENPAFFDVYRLNLKTGALTMAAKNPGMVDDWVADRFLRVRAATRSRDDGGKDLLVRTTENDEWKKVVSWNINEAFSSGPLGFSYDGTKLYLLDARRSNTNQLIGYDIVTGEETVLGHDPAYDIGSVLIDPKKRTLEGFYVVKERKEFVVLDPSIRNDIDAVGELTHLPFTVTNTDDDNTKWIIAVESDVKPIAFYFYDRATKKADFLFYNKPKLADYTLAPMEPIAVTARDGLELAGYCTYPICAERKNLPTVLLVHGGPWMRDVWGYDPEAQWLANRGYLCIQINFRLSTGYGKAFIKAGTREWGGAMLDDLVDTAQWAIKQGNADPKRIGIMGGSYGGYAALCGATMTDSFACAIDIVGPSNLITLLTSFPPYWKSAQAMFYEKVGNPETEQEFLTSRSPLFYVDNIKIPLLIVQGANDPRVKKAEAEQIVSALKEKNIPYEYMLFADEGHGLLREENRLTFYARAEKFLADTLGGRYEKQC